VSDGASDTQSTQLGCWKKYPYSLSLADHDFSLATGSLSRWLMTHVEVNR
jgi:hypothetical protein